MDERTIEAIKTLVDARPIAGDGVVLDAIECLVKDQPFLPPEMPSWLRIKVRPIA